MRCGASLSHYFFHSNARMTLKEQRISDAAPHYFHMAGGVLPRPSANKLNINTKWR